MPNIADIAATIHADMCNDSRNGYSWEPRWGGDYGSNKTLTINGRKYTYALGSYDCSSSAITAWQLALEGTPFEGTLDAASYTGNMRSVFAKSGLFEEWDTDSTLAERGDVYLNEGSHTAMCQYGGQNGTWDSLSEFSINEFGGVYDGQVGDQTSWESHITGFYNYPWDLTLHYNGAADSSEPPKAWPLQMYQSNGTKAQKFRPKHLDNGYLTLTCEADGRCLDVSGASGKSETPVQLYVPNGTKAQMWKFVRKDDELYYPADAAPYEIVSIIDDDLVLDVQGASDEPGAKVWLYKRNGTTAQEWYRLDNGDGTWTIVNNARGRKLCLDCVGGGK